MQFLDGQWFMLIVVAFSGGFLLGYWRGAKFVLRRMHELRNGPQKGGQ